MNGDAQRDLVGAQLGPAKTLERLVPVLDEAVRPCDPDELRDRIREVAPRAVRLVDGRGAG
jgi:hypothetical protein